MHNQTQVLMGGTWFRGLKNINFLKVISFMAQNEFYREVKGLMYGAGISD